MSFMVEILFKLISAQGFNMLHMDVDDVRVE
jgi:hypothetical protein